MADPVHDRLLKLVGRIEGAIGPRDSDAGIASRSDKELLANARDLALPSEARIAALRLLAGRWKTEARLSEVILELFDDGHESIAVEAIRHSPPFDATVTARLRQALDDPRIAVSFESASILARRRDREVLHHMLAWLRGNDSARVETAIALLPWLLEPDVRLGLLERLAAEVASPASRRLLEDALQQASEDENGCSVQLP